MSRGRRPAPPRRQAAERPRSARARARERHGNRRPARLTDPAHARQRAASADKLPRRRILLVGSLLVVAFGALFVRVATLQAVNSDRLVALGKSQRVEEVALPAARGSLLDRTGAPMALSVNRATLWADPRLIEDPAAVALDLAAPLERDPAELEALLRGDGAFVYLARQVSGEVADTVLGFDHPGVDVIDEPGRVRPAGQVASSLLGDVDIDHNGLSGLEARFDNRLAGQSGQLVVERDPYGNTIASGNRRFDEPVRGNDVTLTIDRTLQYTTERSLLAQVRATGGLGGMAIIADPTTGEVLAMASVDRPVAEDGSRLDPVVSTENLATTTVFEPGSVNKVITLAAALQEGHVNPDTVFDVPDTIMVSDTEFTDSHPHDPAAWSVREILTQSSNVGTIKVAQQVGPKAMDRYLRAFGFGRTSELGLPGESAGLLLPLDEWSGTSIATIPLGQGISVTALQMLSAVNVIANEGDHVEPKLVRATTGDDGAPELAVPSPTRPVVDPRVARQVAAMMTDVVSIGTGSEAAIPGYSVAGKTGTARKPLDTGGYEDELGNYRYVATFAGFVPVERPQLSVMVVIDEPTSDIFGGSVAAPLFKQLAEDGLRRFGIAPPPVVGPSSEVAAGSAAPPG